MGFLLIKAFYYFIEIFNFVILAYCILSWFVRPGSPLMNVYSMLHSFLSPLLEPFRRLLYRFGFATGVDISPWVAMLFLNLAYRIVVRIYYARF